MTRTEVIASNIALKYNGPYYLVKLQSSLKDYLTAKGYEVSVQQLEESNSQGKRSLKTKIFVQRYYNEYYKFTMLYKIKLDGKQVNTPDAPIADTLFEGKVAFDIISVGLVMDWQNRFEDHPFVEFLNNLRVSYFGGRKEHNRAEDTLKEEVDDLINIYNTIVNSVQLVKQMKSTKGNIAFGIGIAVMFFILFLGWITNDGSFSSPDDIFIGNDRDENDRDNRNNQYLDEFDPLVVFKITNASLGKQTVEKDTYPNILLGSKEEYNIIHVGNSFRVFSNPFTTSAPYTMHIPLNNDVQDTQYFLLYADADWISGDIPLVITSPRGVVSINPSKSKDYPIRIPAAHATNGTLSLQFQLEKPSFFNLLSWNKLELHSPQVVEISKHSHNNKRDFNFQVDASESLEHLYVDLAITCPDEYTSEYSDPIVVKVNNYIVTNQNPNCRSRHNKIEADIPLNILTSGTNVLTLETDGFYTLAYSLNHVYFNDKFKYSFNIHNFNDFYDLTLRGDFDKSAIDIKINGKPMVLYSDDIISIIQYIRLGTNTIEILNKPVVIEELYIEKVEVY